MKRGLSPKKLDVWSERKEPQLGPYAYPIEKKNGVITIKRRPPMEITGIHCNEVPR